MSSDSNLVCVLVGLVLVTACGPSVDDPPPRTCGGNEPVHLFDVPEDRALVGIVPAGDVFVATQWLLDDDETEIAAQYVHAIESCGESVAELDVTPTTPTESIGATGPWPMAAAFDEGPLRWLDPSGTAPSHQVFPSSMGCIYEVGGGAATLGTDGTVWFHPDPADPSMGPLPLLSGARVPDYPESFEGDFTDCYTANAETPRIDGEALLVMLEEGPLVRVSVPSGERETIIEAPIGQFTLLEDPRYILWRGGTDLAPERDCCQIQVRDRETGQDIDVGDGTIPGDVDWSGDWVSENLLALAPEDSSTRFTNAFTGATVQVRDWWVLEGVLSDTQLLLSPIGDPGTAILDVATGVIGPSPLPVPPRWDEPSYPDGVVAFEPDGDTERGTLHFLPFGSDSAQVLADDIHRGFKRTQTGTIVFVDLPSPDDETGDLVMVTRTGERTVLAENATGVVVPFHGKADERNEIVYFTRNDDGSGGLWRYVLPQ